MNSLTQGKPIVHYAKVDLWLVAVLVGVILVDLVAGSMNLAVGLWGENPASATYVGISAIFFSGGVFLSLALWGCYKIRYEVAPSGLTVRAGPFRTTLPLQDIVEVFPTKNAASAPAPSLDRLQIDYQKKTGERRFTFISPKDKAGFVRDLASAAPRLRGIGDTPLRLKAEASA
jgi:hypothetical protein